MGKHLGAISSTCYLESGSWNRVGRSKADSVLSLINDCWDRGAGLAPRYRGVTSGQECAARLRGFCCAGLRESPAPCCCFPMLFPFLSLALGWVVWQRILLRRAGGGWWSWSSCLWRGLVHSLASFGMGFLAPCVDHQLMAVPELRNPICRWSPGDLLRAVLELLDSISSWSIRAQLMAVLEPGDPVSGWSSGAQLMESQDPISGWSPSALLMAEPWNPGTPGSPSLSRLGSRESDKPGLNVLLGEAGFVHTVGFSWPLPFCGAGSAGAGVGTAGNP